MTKEGAIAGPKLVEHLVDTVLSFEEASAEVRTLQAVKNRFGSVDEIDFFRMTENGLVEVEDASSLFLTRREGEIPPGVSVAPVFEGPRSLLVEIQGLTVPARAGSAGSIRTASTQAGWRGWRRCWKSTWGSTSPSTIST